jgi:hypothetical protein
MRTLLIAAPITLALAVLAPATAHAQAPPLHVLDVDVSDTVHGQPARVSHFVLSSAEGSVSRVVANVGDASYIVKVRVEHERIEVEVDRSDRTSGAPGEVKLQTAVPLVPGRRLVVWNVARADGTTTQVGVLPQ